MTTLTVTSDRATALRPTTPFGLGNVAHAPRDQRFAATPLASAVVEALARRGLDSLRAHATVAWEKPEQGLHTFGFGVAARIEGARSSGMCDVHAAVAALRARIEPESRHALRLLGGGRFTPDSAIVDPAWTSFGGWQFVLPSLLLALTPTTATAVWVSDRGAPTEADIAALFAGPADAPEAPAPAAGALTPDAWCDAVARSVAEIHAGRYEKSVLARRQIVETAATPGVIVTRLADRFPRCFIFKFSSGGATWLGASPELLVSLDAGRVNAASVAGSQRGCAGEGLTGDPKERAEHGFVVTALQTSLEPLCEALDFPAQPEVMRLPNISHLYTPFTGRPRAGVTILDLVEAVHPTPAVAGWPRAEAIEAIGRLEAMDRGWYAGPIGWLDLEGHGEFAVALRSGLVEQGRATLFAGAGIVGASQPAEELAETETKFGALRDAISG